MAFLTADSVKLLGRTPTFGGDPLANVLRPIAQGRQTALQQALGRIQGQATASSRAFGRPQGEYIPQELGRAGMMAGRGLEDTLYGNLGASSLREVKAQQEHQRNLVLARLIGDQMSSSALSEILGGIGNAAQSGAQLYGAYKGFPRSPSYGNNPTYGSGGNPFGYDLSRISGYQFRDPYLNWSGYQPYGGR